MRERQRTAGPLQPLEGYQVPPLRIHQAFQAIVRVRVFRECQRRGCASLWDEEPRLVRLPLRRRETQALKERIGKLVTGDLACGFTYESRRMHYNRSPSPRSSLAERGGGHRSLRLGRSSWCTMLLSSI